MGAPDSGMQAAEQADAEALLTAFRTITSNERRKHASVLNYWLSIRGKKEFPPLHDFDPLEISDFGPSSVLLELIGGGHDAEVRHLGESLKTGGTVERIIDAPNPSILSSIARKLPIVAISRDFLAFEDDIAGATGRTRCWVTLLPLSSSGAWVDYVYAFVSVDAAPEEVALASAGSPEDAPAEEITEAAADEFEPVVEAVPVEAEQPETPDETDELFEAVEATGEQHPAEAEQVAAAKSGPGFSKLLESVAGLAGFYGQGVKVDPDFQVEPPVSEPPAVELEEPAADEPVVIENSDIEQPDTELPAIELVEPAVVEPAATEQPESAPVMEGALQSKLAEVRARADEARMAQLRATAALHEGLSAAYDFALDAESSPEEYLRLVEAQGMKIQLRAPMAPVVKLAFDGLADGTTIAELETVLAWALKQELPRGSLAQRIEEAGGIDELLNGVTRPS